MRIDLLSYGLKTDPFTLQPASVVTNWAGRSAERQLLTDIVTTPLATDIGTSEFTVIHGEYGSGKSHALRYFQSMVNDVDAVRFRSVAIYVPTIKMDQKTTFLRLYKEIIQLANMNELISLAKAVNEKFIAAKDDVRKELTGEQRGMGEAISDDYLETEVLRSVDSSDLPMLRLVLHLAEESEEAIAYLQGSGTPPANIGLSSRVDNDFAAAKTLGGLFRVLTLSIRGQEPACLATYLFLDEVEAILDDRQTDVIQFFQGIRNLVNELPYHFCLLLSFSGETALIEAVMPQAILQRMTRQYYVELPPLTPDDAKVFVRDLLEQHRPEGFELANPYHPFTEESIELTLERVSQITPRHLFRALNLILIRAVRREGLEGGEEISADVAGSILSAGGY